MCRNLVTLNGCWMQPTSKFYQSFLKYVKVKTVEWPSQSADGYLAT